jgi:uncharacterized membrane-anchored protein YitT (DUF2179 family)
MGNFEITVRHGITGNNGSGGYSYQTNNQATIRVQAQNATQAQNLVKSQFGGQNCAISSSRQVY